MVAEADRTKYGLFLLLCLAFITACGASTPALVETETPTPAMTSTASPPAVPTDTPAPTARTISTDTGTIESAFAQPSGETLTEAPQELATVLYSDPKSFFEIRPPAGWSINEYLDDPRGKVDFRIPPTGDWRQSGAELKVIASLNAPGRDITAARAEIEGSAERLRVRLGASIEVTETTVLGVPAVRMRINIPGKLQLEAHEVIIKPNRYNFTFGAPPHRYDQYHAIAMQSIETLLPILRDLPKGEATRHLVASHIRLAELYLQMGQPAWALEIVDGGLQLDSGNERLLQMKSDLENR